MIFYGDKGESEKMQLKESKTNPNPFEKGKKDVFEISTNNVGEISKVNVSHDGEGAGAGWYLDKVSVKNIANSKTYE